MTPGEILVSGLLTYALHSTIFFGIAWLLTRTLARAPEVRELVWKTALVGALVSTVVQTFTGVTPLSGRLALSRVERPAPSPARVAAAKPARVLPAPDRVDPVTALVPGKTTEARATAARLPGAAAAVLPWVWAALATLLVLRFLVAKILLQVRIGRRALVRDPHLLEIVDLLREEAGLTRPIRLTRAEGLASPVALGLSEICIPDAALTDLDREQQESMLAHELAHLVRRDPLWLVGICLLESVFFFQPLLRVARRRIQEAAEYQCDDWAVRRSGSGLSLARCLVKVAEWIDASPEPVPVAAMAEGRSEFVSRIDRLVGNHALLSKVRSRWLLPAGALAVVALAFTVPGIAARAMLPEATPTPLLGETERELERETEHEKERDAVPMTAAEREAVVDALVTALKDTDTEVRRAAARSLGNRRDERAVPGLVAVLSDPDVEVRRAAASGLQGIRDPRAFEGLLARLKDEDAEVRAQAANALGEARDERAAGGLTALLSDSHSDVRRAALSGLMQMRRGVPLAVLLAALKDPDADLRQLAASALSDAEDKQAVLPLIAALSDRSADVRQSCAHALGNLKDPRALDPLIALLKDGSADVRRAAINALASFELDEVPPALFEALKDRDADLRRAAVDTIGSCADPKSVPAIAGLLSDPDPDVRVAAVNALSSVRDGAATRALTTALKSGDPDVRKHAAEALGERNER